MTTAPLRSATRTISPQLSEKLKALRPGQRIRITQTVRVGSTKTWPAVVEGTFRSFNYMLTGLSTDRATDDDVVIIVVHFTKDNGEMSSITLDEKTVIDVVG
jgi:hypothetical protein